MSQKFRPEQFFDGLIESMRLYNNAYETDRYSYNHNINKINIIDKKVYTGAYDMMKEKAKKLEKKYKREKYNAKIFRFQYADSELRKDPVIYRYVKIFITL